ncbi:MAG: hypothetical protein ACFCVA_09535 [Gammaproteobacteria bacterium]
MATRAIGAMAGVILMASTANTSALGLGDEQGLPEILTYVTSYDHLSNEDMQAIQGASLHSLGLMVSSTLASPSAHRTVFDQGVSQVALQLHSSLSSILGLTF